MGDVARPLGLVDAQLVPHPPGRLQGAEAGLDVGAQRQGEAVDDHVLPRDADGLGPLHDAVGDLHPGLSFGGDALLVEGEADDRHPVLLDQGQHLFQRRLLPGDRVHDGPARADGQRRRAEP